MNPTIKTTPKDFFLQLGAIVALYAVVGALINLSFSVINYYFPDVLAGYFYAGSIAWPISMLVVLTPIFYVAERLIVKDIALTPEKANLWIRRWSIFLTLFLTGIVIAGDLITLINTYLSGEIGIRFILKVLVVFIISSTVFKYYFFTINRQYKIARLARIIHIWLGLVLVLVAIIFGFIAVGSPTKQRNIRFDSQRESDLQNVQWQIINYYQVKGKLPTTLKDITDPISGYILPLDPENDKSYEYVVKNLYSFELCADFALGTQDMRGRGSYGKGGYSIDMSYPVMDGIDNNWKHEAGRTCFERTIDPEKYPQIKR